MERLGGGLIGCRWWAALLCCDFLCAPSLFSPLPLSPSPDRRLPGCRRWGWLWCLAGRWLCMGAGVPGSLGWVGLALPAGLASSPPLLGAGLALCPLAAGSPLVPAGLCWALTAWGAAGFWLWLRLGFPGSRLSALVQGWRVSRPCRWWWLGWVMGRRWAWWLAYPVRQIAQIKPCRFGYYSREKAINFERFFLDFVHKVRYNSTRVKEIVNQLRFAASPLVDGGRNPQKGLVKQS